MKNDSELLEEHYGIQFQMKGARYYLRYDAGEIVVEMRTCEVTKIEYEKAKKDEKSAYEVLLATQLRKTNQSL